MSSASEPLHEVAPGLFVWSHWHEEKQIAFNGFFVTGGDANVVIDPPELDPGVLDATWAAGGVACVILTNGHHGRRTAEIVQRTGARVLAPARDADLLHLQVDETYGDGDTLPGGFAAIAIPHSKTPGESALLLPRDGGTLILGDALIGKPEGRLSLLPDEKFKNPTKARQGLRVLLDHEYARVLVADGAQPEGGRAAVEDFLVRAGVRPKRTHL